MAASHYILHGKHSHGDVQIPLTRFEALKFFRKWSATALRQAKKGHRVLFLIDAHKGFQVERLEISTTQHRSRVRQATAWKAPTR
jgi:hypothetical protein